MIAEVFRKNAWKFNTTGSNFTICNMAIIFNGSFYRDVQYFESIENNTFTYYFFPFINRVILQMFIIGPHVNLDSGY